jgi:hypothetical protein
MDGRYAANLQEGNLTLEAVAGIAGISAKRLLVTDNNQIFLSYSRNDLQAAASLRAQLEKRGLAVFKDDQGIREGDQWLLRMQEAVDGCTGFVVLVGRDGVSRWIGAETQVALIRYFGPHEDPKRLPIFPVLLGDTAVESLPAFLRLFQATPWKTALIRSPSGCSSRSATGRSSLVRRCSPAVPSSGSTPSGSTRPGSSSAANRRP